MLKDARLICADQVIETEVCIVGAGAAGITLAREFIGYKTKVCLVESGGLEFDPQTQALAEASTVGDPFLPLKDIRHRMFGGNSNLWSIKIGKGQKGVRYAPLDEIDFEKRDGLPYSGWPIERSHLEPYYKRAQSVCQAGPFAYDPDTWENEQAKRLPVNEQQMLSAVFHFGRGNVFSQEYRDELIKADNITVLLNLNAVEIETNESVRTATRLRVASLQGNQFWIAAKVFILAQGGLENPRTLLMSNRQQTAGLGNQHDVVGRYFMDHPLVQGGDFIPADANLFNKMSLYDLRRVNDVPVLGYFKLPQELMRREQLVNISTVLFPRPSKRQLKAIESFKAMAQALVHRKFSQLLSVKEFVNIIGGIDYVMLASYLAATKNQSLLHGFHRGGWSELPNNQPRFKVFEVIHQVEQLPNPANRVVLSKERDPLGCQKLELHWRWDTDNALNIQRSQKIVAQEFASSGLGEYRIEYKEGLPKLGIPSGTAHHMGTTRMHIDPKQGVVDENCQVHGISNLFIAGSSVFPTGGYANPTLTIVALSIRLADWIKKSTELVGTTNLGSGLRTMEKSK
ncbi:GMC oxidoreductase [Brasilonema octagenarum]|uniref:GMC family oxidoreductase n=1 Tax=Brasilonema octagenarum UFV-OR1 TaxID=417115 RepID=A0ABX1MDM3_9CYAN|nr:GMC family oxidoreductase [Brasilonema octagenarum]NMF66724.1 GMC family oxidoreductase [Brasilonema octagenarum UFV-OR1]